MSRRLGHRLRVVAFGLVAFGLAAFETTAGTSAWGGELRFHILRWRQDFFGITFSGKDTESKELGPSLQAAIVLMDSMTGKQVTCTTQIQFRKVSEWEGKPIVCGNPGVGQDGDPHHRYTFTTQPTSEHGVSDLLPYFRIDQDAATVSFCLLGTRYNTCSGETPIPTAK